jgi:hypothetical protein
MVMTPEESRRIAEEMSKMPMYIVKKIHSHMLEGMNEREAFEKVSKMYNSMTDNSKKREKHD